MFADPWFWAYLAGAVAVHWALPARARGWWIGAASFVLLAMQGERHEGLRGAVAAVVAGATVFALAPRMAGTGPKRLLAAAIAALVLLLAVFKYLPPLFEALWPSGPLASVVAPLGLSYFTFKLIHYAVESSRGNVRDRSPGTFLAWLLLAPTFTAGPIERFDHFVANREDRFATRQVVEGLTRVVHGVVKKFLIAEWLVREVLCEERDAAAIVASIGDLSARDARAFVVGSFLYAYFDFAGYSDIAIGASRLFGARIQENFDAPLVARNISAFWKKWHMTLAGWCQSYVYMPAIGLTRNPYAAIYATFCVMGLWHAANWNYLAWGVWHATGVATALTWSRWRTKRGIRPATSGWRAWWGVLPTFVFVTVSFVFSSTEKFGFGAALKLGARALGIEVRA